jgi:monovalent cation/hydrogen antiporter
VKRRYELQLRKAEAELEAGSTSVPAVAVAVHEDIDQPGPPADVEIVRKAMEAERQRLAALRSEGTIGDAAFQRVEQELDWTELDLQHLLGAADD